GNLSDHTDELEARFSKPEDERGRRALDPGPCISRTNGYERGTEQRHQRPVAWPAPRRRGALRDGDNPAPGGRGARAAPAGTAAGPARAPVGAACPAPAGRAGKRALVAGEQRPTGPPAPRSERARPGP